MEPIKRAAIYTRISKDREGRELGVKRQEDDCRALAERLGYDHVTVFSDNDVSASTLSQKPRPRFIAMMAAAEAGEFAGIIAYSNSRLTRRVVEIQAIIDVTKRRGVRVHTVASGQHDLDTADGRASMLTIAVWDQAEAERTGERIRRQKRQRADDGHWHGGAAPYGYRAEDTRLVVAKPEADRIKEASKRLLDFREPLHAIVVDWNKRGVTTRGGFHWRQSNLRSILMNRSLLGETKSGVVGWKPLLDGATFDRLQALFNDPSRKTTQSPGVRGGKYSMGGGLSKCQHCGCSLTSTKRADSGRSALICNKQVNGSHPTHDGEDRKRRVKIDHDHLEAFVFARVLEALEARDLWHERTSDPGSKIDVQIDALQAQRTELRERRDRVEDAIYDGKVDKQRAYRQIDSIDAELAGIEAKVSELNGRPNLAAAASEGVNWREWSPDRRRSFLSLLVDRVVVGDYPHGVARNGFRKSGETDAEYADRQRERREVALDQRVQIVWKWAA